MTAATQQQVRLNASFTGRQIGTSVVAATTTAASRSGAATTKTGHTFLDVMLKALSAFAA
jgi:imidazoleglycerol phosphate dehydratase HisB